MRRLAAARVLALAVPLAVGVTLLGALPAAALKSEEGLFGSAEELAGWAAIREDKLVRAREIGERLLARDPGSFAAHYLVGYAQHYGEANLPRALYHLRRAKALFESRHGKDPRRAPRGDRLAPWRWHQEILLSLAWVAGELDLHEERIANLKQHDACGYTPSRLAEQAWPLMKLGRLAEARARAREALLSSDPWQRKVAATALCGIEFESGDREAAYRACSAAVDLVKGSLRHGTTELCNGGVASMAVLRFDEAERRFLDATKRPPADYANPWRRLVSLYTREGRLAEAVSAAKQIGPYRMRRPPHVDQHDQAETEATLAAMLLVAGYWQDALRIADRALDRPDRQGGSSTSVAQAVAGAAILARAARLEAAERLDVQAAVAPFWRSLPLRARSVATRLRAWAAGRRAATLLAEPRRLVATMRPHSSGGAEGPEWLLADTVRVIGSGVAARALALARAQEPIPGAHAYLDVLEADVRLRRRDHRGALDLAERALRTLPPAEGLLAARAAIIGAEAARARGDHARAILLYHRALGKYPGVVRQLGVRLPVRVQAAGPVAERAARLLARSPRFEAVEHDGLWLSLQSDGPRARGCLGHARGTQLGCAEVTLTSTDVAEGARRLAEEVHERLFAAKVDLSQSDLRSLDGSPAVGSGRAALKVRDLLNEIAPTPRR